MRKSRHVRNERGASAVEFALVVPLLIVVVFGILNFGVVFGQSLALGNGARQAARLGATFGPTCADIRTSAKNNSSSIGLTPGNIADSNISINGSTSCVQPPCKGSTAGASVRVVVAYRSNFVVPMPIPGFPSGVDIQGQGEFRCEFS